MGRSRGGLTTKIHSLVDANGIPIALKLTAGQAHDGRSATDMVATLGKGDLLLADRAYDSDALRIEMAARGAWANIKAMPNRKRRPAFSTFLYRYRNLIERFFSKLTQFRAVATRYDKRDDNFLASVQLASIRIWLRHNESVAYHYFGRLSVEGRLISSLQCGQCKGGGRATSLRIACRMAGMLGCAAVAQLLFFRPAALRRQDWRKR